MDIYTGSLRALREFEDVPKNMERVPAELDLVARMKLRMDEVDRERGTVAREAQVNLRSSHPLAKWAAKLRAEKKRKAKIAATSRRRNRHGQR